MSNNFFISNLHRGSGGPWIFCKRLKNELVSQGIGYSKDAYNRMSIISGAPEEGKFNILRLDGLYFYKCRQNKNIFKSRELYDHIIYQGDFCKQQYEAFTGTIKDSTIIRNGVPDSFFNQETNLITCKNPVVVASAHWRRHKRLNEIIEAFSSPKLKNVELWVLNGKGFKGKVTDNVKLMSNYKPSKLPQILQSATAMIHLAWLDWCPNSVIEGLASGLPVLCSHNGGTKELVKDDGIIIELEEDYKIGTRLDLYSPPKVDIEIIVKGIQDIIEMPSVTNRDDLKISNVASKYKQLFK